VFSFQTFEPSFLSRFFPSPLCFKRVLSSIYYRISLRGSFWSVGRRRRRPLIPFLSNFFFLSGPLFKILPTHNRLAPAYRDVQLSSNKTCIRGKKTRGGRQLVYKIDSFLSPVDGFFSFYSGFFFSNPLDFPPFCYSTRGAFERKNDPRSICCKLVRGGGVVGGTHWILKGLYIERHAVCRPLSTIEHRTLNFYFIT